MRAILLALAALLLPVLVGSGNTAAPALGAEEPAIVVTSIADAPGTCPHPSACTLRSAMLAVNAGSPETFIRFDPAVFPPSAPAVIAVQGTPLPALIRDGAVIDGSGAGVVVRHSDGPLSLELDGLRLVGTGAAVRHLRLEGFTGSCIVLDGVGSQADDLDVRNCSTGVLLRGTASTLRASRVAVTDQGPEASTAIHVAANGVVVGGAAASGDGNVVSGGSVGIVVSQDAGVDGVRIEGNTLTGLHGPCLLLGPATIGSLVVGNAFERCGPAIAVAAEIEPAPAERNTFRANTFSEVDGIAIDLGNDGVRNPPGGTQPGPNGWIASPTITRATAAAVQGQTCPGCLVELYLAYHEPGGTRDYGTVPLGTPVMADATGKFETTVAVSPGQWVTATATDASGNTSEFGLAARVGAGSVLCGNVQLHPGWNHVAYFGAQPLLLGDVFPSAAEPSVVAIYQAVDGTLAFRRWLAGSPAGRTLETLQPGAEYWFLATSPVTLPGGFSVTFPVPVTLQAGWNDITYIGGSADPRDALRSIEGKWTRLARWDAGQQRWLRFDDGMAPAWALNLVQVEACAVYQVYVTEPATLVPLQP